MSGGSVINSKGELVAIHGRAERQDQVSMELGKLVATGTNQAVPITYYRQFNSGGKVFTSNTKAITADNK